MTSRLFIFIFSAIVGAGLLCSGAYLIIDNLMQPQGLLFEGIVISGLGAILILMVMVALSIGQTIMIFGNILTSQAEIQKEMREMSERASSRQGNIGSLLSNIIPGIQDGTTSISITDLTGQTPGSEIPLDLQSIRDMMMMKKGKTPDIKNMSLEELEIELSKAVKKDDFERAEKINQAIKFLKGGNDPEENN
jgi:pyruvate/2-oxoglutarate dehydrogenase complex dihydrolipoamide dehydrogenase (E3) component